MTTNFQSDSSTEKSIEKFPTTKTLPEYEKFWLRLRTHPTQIRPWSARFDWMQYIFRKLPACVPGIFSVFTPPSNVLLSHFHWITTGQLSFPVKYNGTYTRVYKVKFEGSDKPASSLPLLSKFSLWEHRQMR